jgi:hypothetical protein
MRGSPDTKCRTCSCGAAYTNPSWVHDTYQEWHLTDYCAEIQDIHTGPCIHNNYAGNVYTNLGGGPTAIKTGSSEGRRSGFRTCRPAEG